MREGIVLRAANGLYTVQAQDHHYHCSLRGNLKKDLRYTTSAAHAPRVTHARRAMVNDPVAIGDRVRISEAGHGAGVIEEVLPRRTRFTRAGFRGKEQTLVCNIDQLVIVFACAEPQPDLWKLDRFLVAAETQGLAPLIVANKRDLVGRDDAAQLFAEYRSAGYPIVVTSASERDGTAELAARLVDRVSAFVGPSGAGKSSLLNAVQPGLNLRTSEVGGVTHKGRHTTTTAQLIPLRAGGWVADTPGLRQLDLLDASRDEIESAFPEFRLLLGRCRFQDCRHDHEPDCAVKLAVAAGELAERRYRSFLALSAEASPRS